MAWYRHLLWHFAIVYGVVVVVRNLLFDLKILRAKQFDIPVICVGNLEMGGTGKTPVVSYIVQMLLKRRKTVAVISRGYGRKTKGFRMVEADSAALEVGDEPLMLKRKYPDAIVAVCEKRVYGIEELLKRFPALDFVVMDDGLQHRWVKPSFSILVTNASRPFMSNWTFPVGSLREPFIYASRADVVVITDVSRETPDPKGQMTNLFLSSASIRQVVQVSSEHQELTMGKKVLAFSGIANDFRFVNFIKDNFVLLGHVSFADHHHYTRTDVQLLREKIDSFGAGLDAVITTEKDAVRLIGTPLIDMFGTTPLYYFEMDVEFLFGRGERLNKMILKHGKHA